MSALLRMSLVCAGIVVPMRLAAKPIRMVQVYAGAVLGYYALLRVGIIQFEF